MKIKVSAFINKPVHVVWDVFNTPKHVMQWNHADDSWHCPTAKNDLKVGGHFSYRMAAKDDSFGFDFEGVYDTVILNKELSYTMPDDRSVIVYFKGHNNQTLIETEFDLETENSEEDQRSGWQAILDNFKKYTESLK